MLAAPCPGDCALPQREARLTLGWPEGRKQTLCGARRATPTSRGAGCRRPGASSRPPLPEGAGPGGHLLPAPTPTLRNATWPLRRSGGNPASGESAWGQEVAHSSFRRAFPERLLCARRWECGPLRRGEVMQNLTRVGTLEPPPHLPPAVELFPLHREETEARLVRGFPPSCSVHSGGRLQTTTCPSPGADCFTATLGCCNGVSLCTLT
ncbi:uncharacterized protein LOC121012037 [Herpailurus yagouaroundi]|uniref:uncharacterized protein LOC121012037 n=1 Tax=Herpailurus yagouaroundi TaxID=1608482 RepID=UPI001AD7E064|nr:uncharacterized protein LOC121012037 [Puma yagouaroundi]